MYFKLFHELSLYVGMKPDHFASLIPDDLDRSMNKQRKEVNTKDGRCIITDYGSSGTRIEFPGRSLEKLSSS